MSIIRTVFVLGIVVVLLPTDASQQAQLRERISQATQWASGFCDRNPGTCANAEQIRVSLAAKAEFGAKLLYAAITSYIAGSSDGSPQPVSSQPSQPPANSPLATRRSTLTANDLEPVWRGSTRTADRR